jgi:hypothetical protein
MPEKITENGEEFYIYSNGAKVPKEIHEKSCHALTKARKLPPQEVARRKRLREASIYDVKKHLAWYLAQDGFMESYANKKAIKSVGLPEDEPIQWQALMWSVCATDMIQNRSLQAVDRLLKIDEHQSLKKHRQWERRMRERREEWEMNGKGRTIESEIVESEFGETKV